MARTTSTKGSDSETVFSTSTTVRGRIRGSGSVTIEGSFSGDIQVDGPVTLGEEATVESPIRAEDVTILGELVGEVVAQGTVRLGPAANVTGDMKSAHFAMSAGANFFGRLDGDFDLPTHLTATEPAERKRR